MKIQAMSPGVTKEVWEQFVRGLPAGSIPQVIFDSWQRSRAAGVSLETPSFHRIGPRELKALLGRSMDLILLAAPELRRLSALLPKPNVTYLTDTEGTVLHSMSTSPEAIDLYGLAPGFRWPETLMGTNGAGTALATGEPVAVIGCDHYCAAWHGVACLAAPLHGKGSVLTGAIDVTIPAGDARPEHLAEVVRSALMIERRLCTAYG